MTNIQTMLIVGAILFVGGIVAYPQIKEYRQYNSPEAEAERGRAALSDALRRYEESSAIAHAPIR